MSKLKICVPNPPSHFPEQLKTKSGKVYLDVFPDASFSMSKSVSQYTIAGITTDVVTNYPLPISKRNSSVIDNQVDTNIFNNNYDTQKVLPIIGHKVLREDELCVLSDDDAAKSYETGLRIGSRFWETKLKETSICDCEYEDFEFTEANILDNQANNVNGSQSIIGFPLVSYNGWLAEDTAMCEDFRPHVNIYELLKQGFCKAGYNLKGNLIDTEYFKRLWGYFLKEDWYDYDGKGVGSGVNYTALGLGGVDGLNVTSGGVLLDASNGELTNTTGASIDMCFCYKGVIPAGLGVIPAGSFTTAFVLFNLIDDQGVQISSWDFSQIYNGAALTFDVCSPTISIPDGYGVQTFVTFLSAPATNFTFTDAEYSGTSKTKHIHKGDTFNIGDMLNCECTFYDVLEAVVHMYDKRISTSECERCVSLDIPCDWVTPFREDVIGFYDSPYKNVQDWTDKVIKNSRKRTSPKNRVFKCKQLSFKQDDKYVESLELPDDSPLFGKTVDFGSSIYTDDCEPLENPKFSASSEKTDDIISSSGALSIPIYSDDEDFGTIAHDISPRILFNFGNVQQYGLDGVTPITYNMNGVETDIVSYASMCPVNRNSSDLVANLVFGDKPNDLYSISWNKSLIQEKYSQDIDLLVYIDLEEYCNIDFKKTYSIMYKGQPLLLRIKSISDFQPCRKISTNITFCTITKGRKL